MSSKWWLVAAAAGVLALGIAACGDDDDDDSGDSGSSEPVSGTIRIDGSSTVGPLTSAIAEGFNEENPDVNITVGTVRHRRRLREVLRRRDRRQRRL